MLQKTSSGAGLPYDAANSSCPVAVVDALMLARHTTVTHIASAGLQIQTRFFSQEESMDILHMTRRFEQTIRTYLGQQILTDTVNNLLPREAATAASPLGLGVHDDLDTSLHLKGPEGQVGIGVQPKDLRALLTRQLLNGLHNPLEVRHITVNEAAVCTAVEYMAYGQIVFAFKAIRQGKSRQTLLLYGVYTC